MLPRAEDAVRLARIASAFALALAGALNSGCAQRQAAMTPPLGPVVPAVQPLGPIRHVVIVIQENRTFNDFFATYPGGGGTTTANAVAFPRCHIYKAKAITLAKVDRSPTSRRSTRSGSCSPRSRWRGGGSTPPAHSPSTCRAGAARNARARGTCRWRWSSWPTSSFPARHAAEPATGARCST